MPKLLSFVAKTHPILREIMPEVQDFKSSELHNIIRDMCYSIRPEQIKAARDDKDDAGAAGMAANQWGIKKRVFIYTPDGSEEGNRLDVVINPSYTPYIRSFEKEPKMVAAYEGCFSIPLTTAIVNRYDAIMATYYTPEGKKVERILEGWEARVFQHETDHLDGKLFDGKLDNFAGPPCLNRIIFKDAEEMERFWRNKAE